MNKVDRYFNILGTHLNNKYYKECFYIWIKNDIRIDFMSPKASKVFCSDSLRVYFENNNIFISARFNNRYFVSSDDMLFKIIDKFAKKIGALTKNEYIIQDILE